MLFPFFSSVLSCAPSIAHSRLILMSTETQDSFLCSREEELRIRKGGRARKSRMNDAFVVGATRRQWRSLFSLSQPPSFLFLNNPPKTRTLSPSNKQPPSRPAPSQLPRASRSSPGSSPLPGAAWICSRSSPSCPLEEGAKEKEDKEEEADTSLSLLSSRPLSLSPPEPARPSPRPPWPARSAVPPAPQRPRTRLAPTGCGAASSLSTCATAGPSTASHASRAAARAAAFPGAAATGGPRSRPPGTGGTSGVLRKCTGC